VVSSLARRYGIDFCTDDEADAFGLYRLGLCLSGQVEPDTKAQAQCVEKVLTTRNGGGV